MALEFAPIRSERVYEKVVRQIQDMIFQGRLRRGDKLPSERDMIEQLQISRASLREAYSALELVGIIETRPREGTFIRKVPGGGVNPLALAFLLEEHFEENFLELRRLLELQVVRLAAQKQGSAAAPQLLACIEAMETAENEPASVEADKRFHRHLAQCSGNTMLVSLLDSIAEVVDRHIETVRSELFRDAVSKARLLRVHRSIADAVVSGSERKAEQSMEEHFALVMELTQAVKGK